MKFSLKKRIVSKAWYWRLVARETGRLAGRTFRMQYIRDVATGQREAPPIMDYLRLAVSNVDQDLKKDGMVVVDARKKIAR